MKKFLAGCFIFLFMLKLCTSCSDGNNGEDNDGGEVIIRDTTKPPLTDTLGTDSVYLDSLHN